MRKGRSFVVAGTVGLVIVAALTLISGAIPRPGVGNYEPHIDAYRRVADDYHIVVFVALGYADPILGYDLREDPAKIVVTVHAQNRDFGGGFKQLSATLGIPVTVTLKDRLGQRAVVDSTGASVPEITCPDGTFSCFVGR